MSHDKLSMVEAFGRESLPELQGLAQEASAAREGDLVWVGNWGDEERSRELREFLIDPIRRLGLCARVHGVRYPDHARDLLQEAGIAFAGWLPNCACAAEARPSAQSARAAER